MKSNLFYAATVCGLLVSTPVWVSFKDKPATPADPKSGPAAPTQGLVVEGEKLNIRTVTDSQQGGLAVGAIRVPAKWRDSSQVVWNYQHTESPVEISFRAESPDNAEAYFGYPPVQFFGLRPDSNYYQAGRNYLGGIFAHQQQPPAQILLAFIRQLRPARRISR